MTQKLIYVERMMMGLLMKVGRYVLIAAFVYLWVYGQGKKICDCDRKSGAHGLFLEGQVGSVELEQDTI